MLVLTTPTIKNGKINIYHGLVSGAAILGANVFRDISAKVRDIIGGRSVAYEEELRRAKDLAVEEMVAQATKLGATRW